MAVKQQFLAIKKQIDFLEPVCIKLQEAADIQHKLEILEEITAVQEFLKASITLQQILEGLDINSKYVVKAILAIGQGFVIFPRFEQINEYHEPLKSLIQTLKEIEKFYDVIGGIIGYHLMVLKLILAKNNLHDKQPSEQNLQYDEPEGLDLSKDTPDARQAVRWGIEFMGELAEFYPVGGAGDRLQLQDEVNGHLLPAAELLFCGRTLVHGMVRDLQGREFLHYKLFGKQVRTPLAMMTSHEKNNHERILEICEQQNWFGRTKESFKFFIQPLVPLVRLDGLWAVQAPFQLILKPGGHGVIWKVALDQGVFEWLEQLNCNKALVRQINNPVAGVDMGLFALTGIGCHKNKDFGFASCFRLLNMPEGMNVLCEKKVNGEYEYCITNIEYTEFEQRGIKDIPHEPTSPYSRFPANTNILFINIEAIKRVIKHCPIPGVLINMKNSFVCRDSDGSTVNQRAGRLESTMQNIADYIIDKFPRRLYKGERDDLRTFITYNERRKTLSVTKQSYEPGKPLTGTPEWCYYELMQNYEDLLVNYCNFKLPSSVDEEIYLKNGPAFIAHFHPALGVLYPVIAQKLKGGQLAEGAEWVMEIAEADISNLNLDGSLLIEASAIMGKKDEQGSIVYDSTQCGKCTLINVTVKNRGIDRSAENVFWKHQVTRSEALRITLYGNAEFYAKDVVFEGDLNFEVLDGHRLVASQRGKQTVWHYEKIESSTWQWKYKFDEQNRIILNIN